MNRKLILCLGIVFATFLLPYGVLHVSAPTPEWSLFWQVRTYLVNYTGIVSMILMSLCVILSVKHWPVERWLGGLDQQYRLHKYLGISAVLFALFHWLAFLSDDFVMELGFVAVKEETYPFWKLIDALGDPGQLLGEYGFYLSAAFVLIAWIKKFRYSLFQLTHKVLPYVYLLLVLHMVMFFEASLWFTLPGVILLSTSALATVGCLITILGLNGKTKRYPAQVVDIKPMNNSMEVTLKVEGADSNQFVYQPGQFAFVGFDAKERPHPFSLASSCNHDDTVRLLIKASGDYTQSLMNSLKVGQTAEIEGPYGCFNFRDDASQHIWFAAGIGIAPFLTAIEAIGAAKTVDLFYSYREEDDGLLTELQQRAERAGVALHLRNTRDRGRLSSEEVISRVDDIKRCSVWFCGPSELGRKLERDFMQAKLPKRAFHRELFEFR